MQLVWVSWAAFGPDLAGRVEDLVVLSGGWLWLMDVQFGRES